MPFTIALECIYLVLFTLGSNVLVLLPREVRDFFRAGMMSSQNCCHIAGTFVSDKLQRKTEAILGILTRECIGKAGAAKKEGRDVGGAKRKR